jgi:hypothetical protein
MVISQSSGLAIPSTQRRAVKLERTGLKHMMMLRLHDWLKVAANTILQADLPKHG